MDPEITDPAEAPPVADPTPPSPEGDAGDPDAPAEPQRTVEDVEKYWSAKMAERGRVHKAAETTLRGQIATLEQRLAVRGSTGQQVEGSADAQELEDLRRELADERSGRVVAERRSKYPSIVARLGDDADAFFATGDEVGLAKLNASLEEPSNGGFIAPTAPKRQPPAAAKPTADKSKEELLDDLRRLTPAFQDFERQRRETT